MIQYSPNASPMTTNIRKYAAEQGIAEEKALKKGMEDKSKEFVENGAEFMRRRDFGGARLCRRPAAARLNSELD
ncbi:MAG: hypothetical protein WDN00_03925 [Limisphaerales bacterium]